jgi:N-acetylneuraminate synthase
LQPNYLNALIGKRAKHDFNQYDFFYPSDIEEEEVVKRSYNFNRPWGIPVRYHDFKEIIEGTNADLVEFHLSYKDLEVDIRQFVDEQLDLDFVVHSPELFEGDHTLDLCSLDETYRQRSIKELQRVIEVTKQLRPYFKRSVKPLIVTNVGGFTSQGFLTEQERIKRMRILEASLKELDTEGVELIPQTMPPFPWHFGGQQYHNLFVSAGEIADFCQRNDMRICLDTSHSKLACTHYKWSFHQFLEEVVPYTAHMHFADSENTGGEGLQIGEGEVDYHAVGEVINRLNPNASFIPEIWQGHENRGEGFWIALERLEHLIN